jgi:Ran GTPase-activating protein (RanGAP) involved in mRNA processing and transport
MLAKKRVINIRRWNCPPVCTHENWDILAEVIRTTTSLQKLVFNANTAVVAWPRTATGAVPILNNDKVVDALSKNSTLKELGLRYASCGNKGAKAVAAILKENSTIKVVDLRDNNVNGEGAKAIADALKHNKTLQHISLNSNELSDEGAKAIAEALKVNKALRYIDLSRNQNLSNNLIGDEGAKAMADALKYNKTLQHISLNGNQIGNEGATVIAEALKDNPCLRELHIGRNNIGDQGAKAIAEALKENTSLRKLDIGSNNISDQGAKVIVEALKENESLQTLFIRGNNILEEGGKQILNALQQIDMLRGKDILNALQQIERSVIENINLRWGDLISEETHVKINQEIIRIHNRLKSVGSNEGQAAAVVAAAGGTEHNTTAMETEVEHLKSTITQLQSKIAEQDKELASTKDILKTIGNLANGNDGGVTSNTESSMPDREKQLQSENERYKHEIDSLKEQLKNSRPIETVDLTNEIEPASSSGGEDSNEEEPPSKRQRTKSNLAVALEQTQQLVEVKEEAKERAAVAEANVAVALRQKNAAEASLRDKQEDLEDSEELVTQQTLATNILQGRIDELCELARAAGVDGSLLSEIRYRSLSSGR